MKEQQLRDLQRQVEAMRQALNELAQKLPDEIAKRDQQARRPPFGVFAGGLQVRGNGADRVNHYIGQLGLSGHEEYRIMAEVSTLTQSQAMDYLADLYQKHGRPST
ncbi:hypothetical protein ACX80O_03340 [Arthrobacter sp. Hz1]